MSNNIIKTSNLSFSYQKNVPVLDEISLEIQKGDFIGLIGPNGSGKTTFVKIILGLIKDFNGSIELFNKNIRSFKDWDKIGYVPQKYEREQQFPATVNELFNLISSSGEGNKDFDKKEIIEMLEVKNILESKFIELSGGQQQRVMVGMALLKNPELLILDEPSVGVDIEKQEAFYNLLNKINENEEITIILVSHDVGLVSEHTDKVIALNKSVCCSGSTEDLPEILEMVYGDEFKVFNHLGGHQH